MNIDTIFYFAIFGAFGAGGVLGLVFAMQTAVAGTLL